MNTIRWQTFGHEKTKTQLEGDFLNNKMAHATLLTGPSNIGKFMLACDFAKLLQCEQGNICGECKVCRAIENGIHLDTIIFEDTDEKDIGIEKVRELKAQLNLTSQGKYKIVVIQNIERLSIPSQNALLKILEEPPEDVYFILTTRDYKALMETVVSRCRVVKMRPMPGAEIEAYLAQTHKGLDAGYLKSLAEFSGGRIGRLIISIKNKDNEVSEDYKEWMTKLDELYESGDAAECMIFAEEVAGAKGADRELFFSVLMQFLRTRMIGDELEAEGKELRAGCAGQGAKDKGHLADALKRAQNTYDLINQNVNARLALEVLFLRSFAENSMVNSL